MFKSITSQVLFIMDSDFTMLLNNNASSIGFH